MIPTDIESFITRHYRAADRKAAFELINSATIHDGTPAGPRLIRCALVASGSSLEKLRGGIELLKVDYRDVIVAGEYVSDGGELVRVRDLNGPIQDEA